MRDGSPIIYVTMIYDGIRLPIKASEISGMQDMKDYTRLFLQRNADTPHSVLYDVKETPEEIGDLIVKDLLGAGSEVKVYG